jgi:Tol biopolymer transport system component
MSTARNLFRSAFTLTLIACHSDSTGLQGEKIGAKPPPAPVNVSFPLIDKVVYVSYRYKPTGDLFTVDVRTLAKQRIASNGEDPRCPSVAPDGKGLAYLTDGGLVIVSASGAKTVSGQGCPLWSADGARVLSKGGRDGSGEQLRVYSSSGDMLSQQATGKYIGGTAWSPDGKRIAYTGCVVDNYDCVGPSRLFVVPWDTLNSQATRTVADGFGDVSYSPTGAEIAFLCSPQDLCIVPEASGPVRHFGRVSTQSLDWSAARNVIAYVCAGVICIVDPATGNTTPTNTRARTLRWAPDGGGILFQNLPNDVFAINADGSNLRNLTRDRGWDDLGGWTPLTTGAGSAAVSPQTFPVSATALDDEDILYEGNARFEAARLQLVHSDGSHNRRLFNAELQEDCPSISPDRRVVAFSSLGLWVAAVDGSSELEVSDSSHAAYIAGPDACPVWSPDGKHLAWGHRTDVYTWELLVADLDPVRVQRLDSTDRISNVQWSADGSTIYYARSVTNPQPGDYDRLWSATLGGSPSAFGNPDWSILAVAPDGRLAIQCGTKICVSDANGTNAVAIADGGYPLWSPDGTRIAYVVYNPLNASDTEIRLIRPDGADQRTLTAREDFPSWLSWSPDGAALSFEVPSRNVGVVSLADGKVRQLSSEFGGIPSWTFRRMPY